MLSPTPMVGIPGASINVSLMLGKRLAIAAAAATAAPIMIKLAEFLSKLGIDVKEVSEVGKRVLAKQVKNVVEKKLESDAQVEQASQDEIDRIVNQTDNFNADGSKKMNYLPIVIGGAVIIYLISRKK